MNEKEAIEVLVKAYVEKNFAYKLLYPSIIVRVLPKPDRFGLLYIPDQYKNKPVYEGVVMQTWEKKTVVIHGKEHILTPELKQGDLVLFSHWAGQPISVLGFDEEEWRILPDKSVFNKPGYLDDPSPFCILDIEKENPKVKFSDLLCANNLYGSVPEDMQKFREQVFAEFDIVVKHTKSELNYIEPTRPD